MKAIQRGDFTTLSAYIKTLGRSHAIGLMIHLKASEKQEESTTTKSR